MIRLLLKDSIIKEARIVSTLIENDKKGISDDTIQMDKEEDEEDDLKKDLTSSFEINPAMIEPVKKRCGELDFPLYCVAWRLEWKNTILEMILLIQVWILIFLQKQWYEITKKYLIRITF